MQKIILSLLFPAMLFAGHINVLCIGQSNMQGGDVSGWTVRAYDKIYKWTGSWVLTAEPILGAPFGNSPCTALGNQLCKMYGDTIYLMNTAVSGTGLYSGSVRLWNARGAGTLYQASIDSCAHASMTPDVVFMMHGNADIAGTTEAQYLSAMNTLAADFRTSFSNVSLPVIIAVMGYESGELPTAIRAAQTAYGNSGNWNNRCITGLEQWTFGNGMVDVSHYSYTAEATIGYWFANDFIKWRCPCH